MQAMILAAGFGTRLQPYTLIRPKPLFPVLNQPLLLATIARLKNAGFSTIVINCHHLGQQVISAIENIPGIVIQEEKRILGTGGGLARAVRKLADKPLLVTNGDIYHSVDFAELYRYHLQAGNEVTMVLHDHPRFNKLAVAGTEISDFMPPAGITGLRAFTGIQVVNPVILQGLSPDEYSCIIAHYRSLLDAGRRISCRIDSGINWTDMGTIDDYLTLHQALLQGTIPRWAELHYQGDSPILVDEKVQCGRHSRFLQWASIGKASIGDNVELKRCVVWDGAEIAEGSTISDSIIAAHQGTLPIGDVNGFGSGSAEGICR